MWFYIGELNCYDDLFSLGRYTIDISENIPYLTTEGRSYKVTDTNLEYAIDTLGQLEDIYERYEDDEDNND